MVVMDSVKREGVRAWEGLIYLVNESSGVRAEIVVVAE
jgi:hypothetical protein